MIFCLTAFRKFTETQTGNCERLTDPQREGQVKASERTGTLD